MTNTKLLTAKIADSGFKISYIAEQMGISRSALWKKINNKSPFNQYEIEKLCKILNVTKLSEKDDIFFARDVD